MTIHSANGLEFPVVFLLARVGDARVPEEAAYRDDYLGFRPALVSSGE